MAEARHFMSMGAGDDEIEGTNPHVL